MIESRNNGCGAVPEVAQVHIKDVNSERTTLQKDIDGPQKWIWTDSRRFFATLALDNYEVEVNIWWPAPEVNIWKWTLDGPSACFGHIVVNVQPVVKIVQQS